MPLSLLFLPSLQETKTKPITSWDACRPLSKTGHLPPLLCLSCPLKTPFWRRLSELLRLKGTNKYTWLSSLLLSLPECCNLLRSSRLLATFFPPSSHSVRSLSFSLSPSLLPKVPPFILPSFPIIKRELCQVSPSLYLQPQLRKHHRFPAVQWLSWKWSRLTTTIVRIIRWALEWQ